MCISARDDSLSWPKKEFPQFNRLHSLTWILSIKMRTFGACGGGGGECPPSPPPPPLVTGLNDTHRIVDLQGLAHFHLISSWSFVLCTPGGYLHWSPSCLRTASDDSWSLKGSRILIGAPCFLRWLDPVFWGVPSYFEALWYPHPYFYRKSNS